MKNAKARMKEGSSITSDIKSLRIDDKILPNGWKFEKEYNRKIEDTSYHSDIYKNGPLSIEVEKNFTPSIGAWYKTIVYVKEGGETFSMGVNSIYPFKIFTSTYDFEGSDSEVEANLKALKLMRKINPKWWEENKESIKKRKYSDFFKVKVYKPSTEDESYTRLGTYKQGGSMATGSVIDKLNSVYSFKELFR